MKDYLVTKLVEQLLINSIMYKNVRYEVIEHFKLKGEHTYIGHNLKAEIEDNIIWFNDNNVPDLIIEKINIIEISDDNIKIILADNEYINIKLAR